MNPIETFMGRSRSVPPVDAVDAPPSQSFPPPPARVPKGAPKPAPKPAPKVDPGFTFSGKHDVSPDELRQSLILAARDSKSGVVDISGTEAFVAKATAVAAELGIKVQPKPIAPKPAPTPEPEPDEDVDDAQALEPVKAEREAPYFADDDLNYMDLSLHGGLKRVDLRAEHPIFELVLRLVTLPARTRPNILLVGPAGSGKTTLGYRVAAALQRRFASISLSAGATESLLTCWVLPIHEGGKFGALDSEFLACYQESSVIMLDELDAADPNMLLVVNSALANQGFHVPQRAVDGSPTYIERHPDNIILAAANTHGTGATSQYVGRSALDAATLDRYLVIEMDYDPGYEASIMGVGGPPANRWQQSALTDPEGIKPDLRALHRWVLRSRAAIAKNGLRRILSTRALQKAVALRTVGCSVSETMARLTVGWSADELAAIGMDPQ